MGQDRIVLFFDLTLNQKIRRHETKDIHQTIPADLQGADGYQGWIYVGVW